MSIVDDLERDMYLNALRESDVGGAEMRRERERPVRTEVEGTTNPLPKSEVESTEMEDSVGNGGEG